MSKETIDLTPTWEQALKAILLVLEAGDAEGKKIAKQELTNMAKAADIAVQCKKIKADAPNPSEAYDQISALLGE